MYLALWPGSLTFFPSFQKTFKINILFILACFGSSVEKKKKRHFMVNFMIWRRLSHVVPTHFNISFKTILTAHEDYQRFTVKAKPQGIICGFPSPHIRLSALQQHTYLAELQIMDPFPKFNSCSLQEEPEWKTTADEHFRMTPSRLPQRCQQHGFLLLVYIRENNRNI